MDVSAAENVYPFVNLAQFPSGKAELPKWMRKNVLPAEDVQRNARSR